MTRRPRVRRLHLAFGVVGISLLVLPGCSAAKGGAAAQEETASTASTSASPQPTTSG